MGDAVSFAIETSDLTRTFGSLCAVNALSLRVPLGSFYGFIGPNGAGKSTTINMLAGLLRPSSGSARVLGMDLATESLAIKRRLGVMPERSYAFERLTGEEQLAFVGELQGLDDHAAMHRVTELLSVLGLANDAARLVGTYSHGMRKKLDLACALIHSPDVLILDEPFEGIDAIAARYIYELLAGLVARRRMTIVLSSHVLAIVERLCSHIGVLVHGRLVAQGSLEEVRGGRDGVARPLEERFVDLAGQDYEKPALDWLWAGA